MDAFSAMRGWPPRVHLSVCEAAAAWEPRRGAGRGRRELGREQRPGVLVWVGIELLAVRGTLVILKYFMSYII